MARNPFFSASGSKMALGLVVFAVFCFRSAVHAQIQNMPKRAEELFSVCLDLRRVPTDLICSGTHCYKERRGISESRDLDLDLSDLGGQTFDLADPQGQTYDPFDSRGPTYDVSDVRGRSFDPRAVSDLGGPMLDVGDLQNLMCEEAADCLTEHSRMVCQRGKCTCPSFHAFNVSSCRCERADFCRREDDIPCHSHNNRRCADKFCSCFSSPNFSGLLLDPLSLFCVLPAQPYSLTGLRAEQIVLAVVGALGLLLLLLVFLFFVHRYSGVCKKGDYKCDTVDAVPELEVHNATWDYPSLDYVPKDEEIVFTLAQAKDMVGASNASTIHVTDEIVMYNLQHSDHENPCYIEEEVKNDLNHNS